MKTRHYLTTVLALAAVVAFALFFYAPEPDPEREERTDAGSGVEVADDRDSSARHSQKQEEAQSFTPETSLALTEKGSPEEASSKEGTSGETEFEMKATRYEPDNSEALRHREQMWESTEVLAEKTRELGYFSAEEREMYESYSLDILEALLEDGDIRAYPVIIDQYASDDSREYITWASFTAAIHGSTPAIGMLAHLESSQAEYERLMENESEAKDRLLHAQALYKSATTLGDPYLGASAQQSANQFELQLDEQDRRRVDDLAEQFIGALNDKRRAQGLAELSEASEELLEHYERLGISSPWDE